MKCSFPPPLTDDQLTDALDGVADRAVDDHLAGCAYCSTRLAQARQAELVFHARLHRFDCPTPQQLGDYQLKLLGRADVGAIARHLKECVRCNNELEELLVYLGMDPAVDTPARQAGPVLQPLGKLFGQILPRTPALAVRGVSSEPIIAEAEGTTIILNMDPAPNDRVRVHGQVVANDPLAWTSALVELRQAGMLEATATVNDFGGFSLGPIPATISELRITPQFGRMLVLLDIPLAT